jgi:hypothetical protein
VSALSSLLTLSLGSSVFATEEAPAAFAEHRLNAERRTNAIRAKGNEACVRGVAPGSWLSEGIKREDVVTVEGDAARTVSDILIRPDGRT